MRIGFIIHAWQEMSPEQSSTLRLIHECCLRGHQVSLLSPQNLTVRNNVVHGFVKKIREQSKISQQVATFYKRVEFLEKMTPLHAFDAIMIRKDPPINPLVLNFLDSIKDETFIINDVDGLRKANNKLYTTTFHDPENTFLPVTHVSKNKEYLKKAILESEHQKMILKPLDGSGGRGVIVLEKEARSNVNSLLDFYIDRDDKSYVIVQEYIDGAQDGDVRVLMLNGKILGAYQRKPAKDDIRANIHAGGSAHKYQLSKEQQKICQKIGKKLVHDGLYFVGLDLIGLKLLEVNVLNPGGIRNINLLNKTKLQRDVVDFIESQIDHHSERRAENEYRLKRVKELRSLRDE